MRAILAVLALAVATLVGRLAIVVDASTGPIPLNCNRQCLEGSWISTSPHSSHSSETGAVVE